MSETPTAPAFAEEVMLLAEKLGELNERLAKAEADLAAQTAPLDATKAAQDATLAALSAALSGIKALNFHVLGNDLGAVSKRVEVVAEQADTAIKALSAQVAESQSAILSAKCSFAQQLAQTDTQRMELARKRDEDTQAFTAKFGELQLEINHARATLARELQAAIKQFATPAGLNPRGEWDAQATYARLDVVTLNGTSYVSQVDGNSDKPGKSAPGWQVLARRGSSALGGGATDITGVAGMGATGLQLAQAGTAAEALTILGPIPTTDADAATTAEALAGVETDVWISPATGNERALDGDISRAVRDAVYHDGTTAGGSAVAALGAVGDGLGAAGGRITVLKRVKVPTSAETRGLWSICNAIDGSYTGNALNCYLLNTDKLRVEIGDVSSVNRRYISSDLGVVSRFSGRWISVAVTHDGSSSAPIIYINGTTESTAESTGGTAPAWDATFSDEYFIDGAIQVYRLWYGRAIPSVVINAVLTASEVLEWTQTGRMPSWCEIANGSMVSATSGLLVIGRRYRLKDFIAGDDFTNVGAGSNADGVEFTATGTTPTAWTNSSEVLTLGPIARWEVQQVGTCYDAGSNRIPMRLNFGVTPITQRRDWIIQATSNTSGNQQLLAASTFVDPYTYTKHVVDDWCMRTAGTPTVSAGNVSAGTQYKASGAIASGRNMITLASREINTANIWVNSNTTDTIYHTIRGHIAD